MLDESLPVVGEESHKDAPTLISHITHIDEDSSEEKDNDKASSDGQNDRAFENVDLEAGEIYNPAHDHRLYRWHLNGRKKLRHADGSSTERRYYRCANHNKPTKEEGCKASYYQDVAHGDASHIQSLNAEHNHPPPSRLRIDKGTWNKCKEMVTQGLKPSQIQRVLRESTPTVYASVGMDQKNNPSRKQIENMAARLKRSPIPTGNSIRHLISVFGGTHSFLRKLELHPCINVIMMSDEGRCILSDPHLVLLLDSDMEVSEGRLILHTIFARSQHTGGKFIPVAWILSDARRDHIFRISMEYICEMTGDITPSWVLCHWDDSLRSVVERCFPSAKMMGDYYHLLTDNKRAMLKCCRSAGLDPAETIAIMNEGLQMIYNSTEETETSNLQAYLGSWNVTLQPYVNYFAEHWIDRWRADMWMAHHRNPTAPVSDTNVDLWRQRTEAWYDLKDVDIVDRMIKLLHGEWIYWRDQANIK
ncbi:hypothetical protein PROFUN_01765 [Planoprotostelium fungivorum]|uniref:WRKY domain-containing protein n=1 Tax=Planoprotostelium fungivorum TaxID=1890364 RepID=A0A2P6MWG1_9EUKA|nr:hypothetical protein PROFUN_01765 [Planoprotostelium fungivorum]